MAVAQITQTSLSAAMNGDAQQMSVVSATNLFNPTSSGIYQKIYVIDPDSTRGELMNVIGVSGTVVTVSRIDKYRTPHAGPSGNGGIGATVMIAPQSDSTYGSILGPYFQEFNPVGTGNPPQGSTSYLPWLNVDSGEQWLYSAAGVGRWVAGWNNPSIIAGVTAPVASVAGLLTPSGPLFHITGALAITGFTLPIGFAGGSFVVIPDGAFTTTTANNIAIASTGVVSKAITFTYDSNVGKFYPSY